jgi:heterodisulfide reductase subunit A2
MASRIGVYVCHCGINIGATVDVREVAEYAASLPHVVVARDYMYMCSDPGQEMIKQDMRDYDLNRVVVASCSPLMHEATFRTVVQEVGVNPYYFEMANIREQVLVGAHRARDWHPEGQGAGGRHCGQGCSPGTPGGAGGGGHPDGAGDRRRHCRTGGGAGHRRRRIQVTYVVERQPSLGGRMAQLNKTFPRMEDAGALVVSEMARAMAHPNVDVLAYSELADLEGYIGNFEATSGKSLALWTRPSARHVASARKACVLAGQVTDDFQMGLSKRAAIYRPFPQALPAVYTVDPDHCLLLTGGGCEAGPPCALACPEDAVDFSPREQERKLQVGAVIVATGYDPFDPQRKPEFGHGHYPGVLSALEFERLAAANGPTGGRITIPGLDREPEHVVFIHCVGSRDKQLGNEYCSRVCCMYTAKQANVVLDQLPDARVTVFYMDVRAFTKGGEEFYDRARARGVRYRRGNPSEVYRRGDKLVVRAEDTLLQRTIEVEADMVVLAVGLEPAAAGQDVAHMLKLSCSGDRFLAEAHPKLRPVDTTSDGIFLAGTCQGPKDIPDTVSQAKAAASSALIPLSRGKAKVAAVVSSVDPYLCVGCGLCEVACTYGALSLHHWRGIMTINEVLCKGCGACSVACPSKAIKLGHFTQKQTLAMLDAMLS